MNNSKPSRPTIIGFSETPSHHLVRFEMPKLLGNEVTVVVSHGDLIVRGGDRRNSGSLPGQISLRVETEQPGVFARFKDGVLIVALPKSDELDRASTLRAAC